MTKKIKLKFFFNEFELNKSLEEQEEENKIMLQIMVDKLNP